MTNFKKLKSMSDKELAQFIRDIVDCVWCPMLGHCGSEDTCTEELLGWLRSEADDSN